MQITRLINVQREEMPRVLLFWGSQFLLRLCILFGWTFLVGAFSSRLGANSLPTLFLMDAAFILFGSIILSLFLAYGRRQLSLINGYTGVAALTLVGSIFLMDRSPLLFFSALLFAISFLLTQAQILLVGIMESTFTPEEAERVFPVIDSADTFGGIIAGALLFTFADRISSSELIFVWIGLTLLLLSLMLVLKAKTPRPHETTSHPHLFAQLRTMGSNLRGKSFMKSLIAVVFFQWLFIVLLDFIFTNSVYHATSDPLLPATAAGLEHAMIHELGALQMVFSLSALMMQLFFVSRIQQWLGVVGSMFIYPILGLMSLFTMMIRPGLFTAALARNNADMTSTLYKNAYHVAYYLFPHNFSMRLRPFLEGMIRPLGSIVGTSFLLIGQHLLTKGTFTVSVQGLVLVSLILSIIALISAQRGYTSQAVQQLLTAEDEEMQFQALEILAQKGHARVADTLEQFFQKWNSLSLLVKRKALSLFTVLDPPSVVRLYLTVAKDPLPEIQIVAARMLHETFQRRKKTSLPLFTKYRLITELKSLFGQLDETADGYNLQTLAHISQRDTVEYLLRVLQKGSPIEQAHALAALRVFHDENIIPLVKPFLDHTSPFVREQAQQTLMHFTHKTP